MRASLVMVCRGYRLTERLIVRFMCLRPAFLHRGLLGHACSIQLQRKSCHRMGRNKACLPLRGCSQKLGFPLSSVIVDLVRNALPIQPPETNSRLRCFVDQLRDGKLLVESSALQKDTACPLVHSANQ